jgi:hypothetical protein
MFWNQAERRLHVIYLICMMSSRLRLPTSRLADLPGSIDGDENVCNGGLIQCGVQLFVNDGVPSWGAWWEWWPYST